MLYARSQRLACAIIRLDDAKSLKEQQNPKMPDRSII
jgi:hypothetical protein